MVIVVAASPIVDPACTYIVIIVVVVVSPTRVPLIVVAALILPGTVVTPALSTLHGFRLGEGELVPQQILRLDDHIDQRRALGPRFDLPELRIQNERFSISGRLQLLVEGIDVVVQIVVDDSHVGTLFRKTVR